MSHSPEPTYLFYDLETTGRDPVFDQILQFAAIRTTLSLETLEEVNLRVRLRPDVIPSPGALLVTQVSIADALDGHCEHKAVQAIHEMVNRPGTISIGYNSLSFDDQFLRFAFYRNLLNPYTHQYQDGCHRLDLYPIAVLYYLEAPQVLDEWPEVDGHLSLKLENLSTANRLAAGQAHDALVDVRATVELARRFQSDPLSWARCEDRFNRTADQTRLKQLPAAPDLNGYRLAVLVDGWFGPERRFQRPVLHLGDGAHDPKKSFWLLLDDPALSEQLDRPWRAPVRQRRLGEPPFVQEPQQGVLDDRRRDVVRQNLKWLSHHPDLLQALSDYHCERQYEQITGVDDDAALYLEPFLSEAEEALCRRFHTASLSERVQLLPRFQRPRLRRLAERLLARNYGLDYLFPRYQAFLARATGPSEAAPVDYRGRRRYTPADALLEIDHRRAEGELTPAETAILDDLERYVRGRFLQQAG